MRHIVHCLAFFLTATLFFACSNAGGSSDSGVPSSQAAATSPSVAADETSDTPTAAYKRLFAAVKAKDTNSIKAAVSKKTQALAVMLSQRNKAPIEKSYENGFTATTFAETLPDIRDERVKDIYGAVEVWNHKDSKWEDLPFILEEGRWKLAIGEVLEDTFQSPGQGLAKSERQAANSQVKGPDNDSLPSNVGKTSNN